MRAKSRVLRAPHLLVVLFFGSMTQSDSIPHDSLRPNIILFLADNLALEDISYVSQSILEESSKRREKPSREESPPQTPNIDRIGQQGAVWEHWNSAAHLCSASRAALLTGQYPVRHGIYPGVFHPDASYGLNGSVTTSLASILHQHHYRTAMVGKWHLGHRQREYLPISHGFDEWLGIPYHMSGGSLDDHICQSDLQERMWLPLYRNDTIVQQPVQIETLADNYAQFAVNFVQTQRQQQTEARERANGQAQPFFLYMAFSHVHQLCAPRDYAEQETCQWASALTTNATFVDAVAEMDWIAGQVLGQLERDEELKNNTIVLFTSDNGPWVAEQACSGSKGPFLGQWLQDNSPDNCTACPHDYKPDHTQPGLCRLGERVLEGVACGHDTGLGSVWEANLRMPTLLQWPGHVVAGSIRRETASSLDVVPTLLNLVGIDSTTYDSDSLDGLDLSSSLVRPSSETKHSDDRALFFWRDGFSNGPLPSPYGRVDVAAMKLGRYKLWFWTKSAHYNDDVEEYHDPPLLFDVLSDPAEAIPLDPAEYSGLINRAYELLRNHIATIKIGPPLTLDGHPDNVPCVDPQTQCRTVRNGADVLGQLSTSVVE